MTAVALSEEVCARMYDPGTGRFLSKDPIGFAGGDTNLYRYVRNTPLQYTDPTGLYPQCPATADGPTAELFQRIFTSSSNSSSSPGIHEEGGWLFGNAQYSSFPMGSQAQIRITPPPVDAYASVHTHPNPPPYLPQPSPQDVRTIRNIGLPGYVVSDQGVYRIDPNGSWIWEGPLK
ncbi:MAG: hypothetical protein A2X94_13570 [Bdellovibrionales bacterium GWB1_55_8]|nr:MAG: hypothetical protein A2X94_13570 [Bdellovibrionales bacterium GWB1_55_8]